MINTGIVQELLPMHSYINIGDQNDHEVMGTGSNYRICTLFISVITSALQETTSQTNLIHLIFICINICCG